MPAPEAMRRQVDAWCHELRDRLFDALDAGQTVEFDVRVGRTSVAFDGAPPLVLGPDGSLKIVVTVGKYPSLLDIAEAAAHNRPR